MARFKLFWRGGYEATSLDGLLNEVGLSKAASTVHSAASTNAPGVSRPLHRDCTASKHRRFAAWTTPRSDYQELRKDLGFQPSSKTAFLQVCAIERGGQDQLVRMRVRRGLELLEEAYRDTIVRGQEAGQFAADADARVLSTFLVANLYGCRFWAAPNIAVMHERRLSQR